MATKRGKSKKKNPCWKGYTAMGDDGQIVMKKKGYDHKKSKDCKK